MEEDSDSESSDSSSSSVSSEEEPEGEKAMATQQRGSADAFRRRKTEKESENVDTAEKSHMVKTKKPSVPEKKLFSRERMPSRVISVENVAIGNVSAPRHVRDAARNQSQATYAAPLLYKQHKMTVVMTGVPLMKPKLLLYFHGSPSLELVC